MPEYRYRVYLYFYYIRKGEIVRLSNLIGKRFKERPADAALSSHAFLLRGGYMRQVFNGSYSLLLPAYRIIKKIENILREEMDRIGGQEVLMPVVLPRELWDESGRYGSVGAELLRFKDRTDHDMLLAMTHEEAVVHLVRHEADSYRQYPFMIYQLQTKFRDEPRSRGGLIRVREFTMKDAYSFHTSQEDLEEYYRKCALAYSRIFARAGIPDVAVVQSDSGMMGGKVAHEYMLLTDGGEDTIVTCDSCGYLANSEVAAGRISLADNSQIAPLSKVHTPDKKTIDDVSSFLNIPVSKTAKAVFYKTENDVVLVMIRGDISVNESKLSKILKAIPKFADDSDIMSVGCVAGYAGPVGIKNCRIILDTTVWNEPSLVTGANETGYHYLNFNAQRDCVSVEVADISTVRNGDGCPNCTGKIVLKRGIEVGNIFQLGTKYAESMKMTYLDSDGKLQTPIMGCYGIGVGRLLASVIEAKHDDYGPIWPMSISPWQVHINALNGGKIPEVRETAEKLYNDLTLAGIEVLYDDRDEQAGAQFADADLFGIPLRMIIGAKHLKDGNIEVKRRGSGKGDSTFIKCEDAVSFASEWIKSELSKLDLAADSLSCPVH